MYIDEHISNAWMLASRITLFHPLGTIITLKNFLPCTPLLIFSTRVTFVLQQMQVSAVRPTSGIFFLLPLTKWSILKTLVKFLFL